MEIKDGTLDLLRLVSSHLSSRSEFVRKEYTVYITDGVGSYLITVDPYVEVFPNIHDRKKSDKRSVISHIFRYHMDKDNLNLTCGVYQYQKSVTGKRRRWIRVR